MTEPEFDILRAVQAHRSGASRWRIVINLAEYLDARAMTELTWAQRRDGIVRTIRESLWIIEREVVRLHALGALLDNLAEQPTQEMAEPIWRLIVGLADEDRVLLETHKRATAGS